MLQVPLDQRQHLGSKRLEVCVLGLCLCLLQQLLCGFMVAHAGLLDVAAVEGVALERLQLECHGFVLHTGSGRQVDALPGSQGLGVAQSFGVVVY
jgi:hypothetical protein